VLIHIESIRLLCKIVCPDSSSGVRLIVFHLFGLFLLSFGVSFVKLLNVNALLCLPQLP
jgi:hypothetical protein